MAAGAEAAWRLAGGPEPALALFEQSVPVKVKRPDREEPAEELIVRVHLGYNKHNSHSKILRITVSSEFDPFFLHSLEVSEEDFQNLKVEQAILVDFSTFPAKLIELLESCIAARDQDSPRFQAILFVRGADSVFSFIETNQFKHLTHLALAFRPGNDAAQKQFLAGRLNEVKGERARLQAALDSTQSSLASTREAASGLQSELSEVQSSHARLMMEMDTRTAALLTEAREKALHEQAELQQRLERDKAESEARSREQESALRARASDLEAQARSLLEQKTALDAQVSTLGAKLGSAEGELDALREDTRRLREQNRTLDAARHEQAKVQAEQAIKLGTQEQQLRDKEEMLAELREHLENNEAHKGTLEGSWDQARRAVAAAEERLAASTAEIHKGNQIIERLQAELRTSRSKAKLKAAVIAQQEAVLGERGAALERANADGAGLRTALDLARVEREALSVRVEDQRKKLEDSQALLQSNQQMIQWLNQQVNEAQLGKLGPATRFAFRPAGSAAATPLSTGAGAGSSPPVGTTGRFDFGGRSPTPYGTASGAGTGSYVSYRPPAGKPSFDAAAESVPSSFFSPSTPPHAAEGARGHEAAAPVSVGG